MTCRHLFSILLPAAQTLAWAAPVYPQAFSGDTPVANKIATDSKRWSAARTPDGQPDLQGVWDAASMTPLERPLELGNKEFYTPQEMAAYEKKRAQDLNRDRRSTPMTGPKHARCPTGASYFRNPARRSSLEITTTTIKSSSLRGW